jgi:hypothetical protein
LGVPVGKELALVRRAHANLTNPTPPATDDPADNSEEGELRNFFHRRRHRFMRRRPRDDMDEDIFIVMLGMDHPMEEDDHPMEDLLMQDEE